MLSSGTYLAEYALEAIMKKCEIDDIVMSFNGSGLFETSRTMNATLGKFHIVHASLPVTQKTLYSMWP